MRGHMRLGVARDEQKRPNPRRRRRRWSERSRFRAARPSGLHDDAGRHRRRSSRRGAGRPAVPRPAGRTSAGPIRVRGSVLAPERFGDALPVVFVSGERTESFDRVAGLQLGADDYLSKPFAPDELIARLRRLLPDSELPADEKGRPALTPREEEVLKLLASGLAQGEIAKELVISPKTVASHIERILAKLGVNSRAQAVAVAHRTGLS